MAPSPPPSPESAEPPSVEPVAIAGGSFLSHEHATSGSVEILDVSDGTRVLRIEGLDISDGLQLEVWLTDTPVINGVDGWGVFDDDAYVSLGPLKGNVGNQNYPIS